jgi:prepilin-type N-terminal cleavage/methylation domain-containing protein
MNGFSLLELSVVVLLLGMLTALLWPLAGARLQQGERTAAHTLLEQADWALTGFIMSKHRLPCPASTQNGEETCAGAGSGETGYLPYKTLGMADARARRIRYGVLRRNALADPEAESGEDPAPDLPRTVHLTDDADQFYPLLAMIGNSEDVFASDSAAALPELGSGEYRPVQSWNVPFGEKNGLDFCFRLRVAEDPLPAADVIADHVHVATPGTTTAGRRQVAYALALPGALEMGAPDVSNRVFESGGTHSGDARVRAVTPGALWKRLECGEAMAAIGHAQPNLATAAVMLYRGLFDFEQSLAEARHLADVQLDMAEFSQVNASVKLGAGGTASILKITGALIAGKADQGVAVGKAIYSMSVATTALGGAQASKESAARSLEMATARYEFAQKLRKEMKPFSERLLHQARVADRRGLYLGRP